jgi:protease stability complex PrcB-like protein
VLVAIQLRPEKRGHPIVWRDRSAQVGALTLDHSQRRLFREQSKLAAFLRRSHARSIPKFDFAAGQLLLISPGPRSSTGYDVEVLSVRERDRKITVRVRERTPAIGDNVDPHVTSPYRLIVLPAGKDVFVDWVGR